VHREAPAQLADRERTVLERVEDAQARRGVVLLFTATTGSCLLYRLFGMDTAKQRS